MSNIKELFCMKCLGNVDGDHSNATRHVVIHASLFPAFRELKEENEKLKADALVLANVVAVAVEHDSGRGCCVCELCYQLKEAGKL